MATSDAMMIAPPPRIRTELAPPSQAMASAIDLSAFRTSTKSIIGAHYDLVWIQPYTPDVLKATRDPLLARKTLLIYGEMARDDMVDLGLSLLISVLAPDLRIVPADDTAEAKMVADKISRQFTAMPGGATKKIYKILLALMFGFSVSEMCFGLTLEGEDAGDIALTDIKYRQPYFFDFITDKKTGELCRIEQIDTLGAETKQVDPRKVIHYIVNDHIDPFRGASIYRPSYWAWWAKQAYIGLRNVQAERFAGKLKSRHEDPTLLNPTDFKTVSEAILKEYQNADGWKEPPGMSTEVVQGEADPEKYTSLIQACDRVLLRPTKIPWLMVQEGIDTGSYALAEVQERVMIGGHAVHRQDIEEKLSEPYGPIWWPCKLNGWSMRHMPSLKLSPALEKDRAKRIELINATKAAGNVELLPQDMNYIRAGLGLEEVDEADLKPAIQAPVVSTAPPGGPTHQASEEFAFCPTGAGGGVDPSCGNEGGAGSKAGPLPHKEAERVLDHVLGGPNASRAVRKRANIDKLQAVGTDDLHRLVHAYESIEAHTGQKSYPLGLVRQEIARRGVSHSEEFTAGLGGQFAPGGGHVPASGLNRAQRAGRRAKLEKDAADYDKMEREADSESGKQTARALRDDVHRKIAALDAEDKQADAKPAVKPVHKPPSADDGPVTVAPREPGWSLPIPTRRHSERFAAGLGGQFAPGGGHVPGNGPSDEPTSSADIAGLDEDQIAAKYLGPDERKRHADLNRQHDELVAQVNELNTRHRQLIDDPSSGPAADIVKVGIKRRRAINKLDDVETGLTALHDKAEARHTKHVELLRKRATAHADTTELADEITMSEGEPAQEQSQARFVDSVHALRDSIAVLAARHQAAASEPAPEPQRVVVEVVQPAPVVQLSEAIVPAEPRARRVRKTVLRDDKGRMSGVIEEEET